MRVWVWGLRVGVGFWGLGCGCWVERGSRFGVRGMGIGVFLGGVRVQGLWCEAWDAVLFLGFRFRVQGSRLRGVHSSLGSRIR